ncbi:MAG: efflux transporter outer membrane subunit [Deltaproteobacteria bacterium]|nr:efflux transporter outer membrane subunit [Deltaproteobacteria bacterium]
MKRNRFLVLVMILTLLGGCTLAPEYKRPGAPVPAGWQAGAEPAKATAVADLPWRDFFPDPGLQKVIETALANNRDLRLAALNAEKARALYGVQRSELLPSVNAIGSGSLERLPADLSSTGSARTSERYDVKLGVSSWEIDFFGRIRSLKDQALEEYLATDEARRSAQILLVANVANAYLALAADRQNLKLAASTLEAHEASYRLIKKRYDVGLASELDLRQSQSQVETARGNAARYTQLVYQDQNALDLLVGSPMPPALSPADLAGITPPREIATALSSEILLRRPDVLASEHQLKAANANIGAARAAFFPRIALTTSVGTASADLSGLFKSGANTWSFVPLITLPIFDARTWSAYDVTKVQREIMVTQYEKAIQTAFREVADALAMRDTVDRQVAAQESLVEAVAETHRLSNARYTRGMDSYLGVLDAQRSLYAAQQGLISLRLSRLSNRVTLYKTLGGGSVGP